MLVENNYQIAALVTDVLKFYRQDVTKFTLHVWLKAMERFDFEQINRAFEKHVANPEGGQFMPKPADIIKALHGTQTDRAALAWGKVIAAASSVGAYTDVVFDDPAIHAAIEDMGGWPKICRTEQKDLSYAMHRFCEQHKAYTGRGQFEYVAQLRGERSADEEYEKKGLSPPKPKLIGNPNLAMGVLDGGSKCGKLMITDAGSLAMIQHQSRGMQ